MVKKQIWWMYWLLVVLSVADFIITKTVLVYEEIREANPVMQSMIDSFGVVGILYFKIFWLLLLAGGILAIADHRYKLLFWSVAGLNAIMLVNLLWSDHVLYRLFYS